MYYPEQMSFVTIASPKNTLRPVIEILHDLKMLQIDDHNAEELPLGKPLNEAEHMAQLLLDLNFIKSHVSLGPARFKETDVKKIERTLTQVKGKLNDLVEEKKQIEERERGYEKRQQDLEFLKAAGVTNSTILAGLENVAVLAGYTSAPKQLEGEDREVFYHEKTKRGYPFVMFVKNDQVEAVKQSFGKGMSLVTLTDVETNDVVEDLATLQDRRASLVDERKRVHDKMVEVGLKHNQDLVAGERFLQASIQKAEAPLHFAVGEHSFLIAGWVPTKSIDRMKERLGKFSSLTMTIEEAKNGPTKLANPAGVKSFEFFLNLYSLPRLKEIDPTFLVFLSFPIFFGMMLGDIGYGLTLYLVFSVLRWRIPRLKGFFDIILLSSIFTVIFGYMFGEFFGAEEILGFHLHPLLHRLHDVNGLIVVSLIFGLVHLNLGFIFGFLNELKGHGLRAAVLNKASWILLEVAGIFLVLDFFFGIALIDATIAWALVGLSVLMLFIGEGIVGLIEIPGLVSSILSYLRLGAVGLASASLALVVNTMAGDMFAAGGAMMALGVMILIMGHTMNILIGLVDAFLQSLRLHYVEMFTKFYGGEGKPYNPFGR